MTISTCIGKILTGFPFWGFHERERVEKGDFFALVDSVEELIPAVQSFFGNRGKAKII